MNPNYPARKKKELTNKNALKDVRCPHCKQEDKFTILGRAAFTVTDEGVIETETPVWEEGSFCKCDNAECGYNGNFGTFIIKNQLDDAK